MTQMVSWLAKCLIQQHGMGETTASKGRATGDKIKKLTE